MKPNKRSFSKFKIIKNQVSEIYYDSRKINKNENNIYQT